MSGIDNSSFKKIDEFILNALQEDIGDGDHTSLACCSDRAVGQADLIIKEEGILAGVEVAERIFNIADKSLNLEVYLNDGCKVIPGNIAFDVTGKARSILKAERLVLNCMQRMSGIATVTNQMVMLLKKYNTKVFDTRKTLPGLRLFDKWAVRIGGAQNHRMGLYDMIMIKDNHIDFAGGVSKAIIYANDYLKKTGKKLEIEIEARNLDEVKEIIETGNVDRIMLDNFSFKHLKKALKLINKKFKTEVSGGVNITNIVQFAECGVDYVSTGSITHSVKAIDMSLKVVKTD